MPGCRGLSQQEVRPAYALRFKIRETLSMQRDFSKSAITFLKQFRNTLHNSGFLQVTTFGCRKAQFRTSRWFQP